MNDVLALLANANPVRVEDLRSLEFLDTLHGRRPRRRLALVAAGVAAATAAALIGVFVYPGTGPVHSMEPGLNIGPHGIEGAPGPVGPPPPRSIAVGDLSLALGAPAALPSTSLVAPSVAESATAGWGCPAVTTRIDGTCVVTVKFPSLTVEYDRPTGQPGPAEFAADVQTMKREAAAHPGSGEAGLLDLNGVPAMFSTGSYSFGAEGTASIHFIVGDTAITIYGHASETALEDLARSVLDRMPSPTRSTLSGASRLIGAPIVLPDTNIVGQADAASTVTTLCPSSGDSACQATVEFPSLDVSYVPLTIRYLRPAPVDPDTSYGSVVKQVHGSAIVSLDGVSALYVPGTPGAQPSWIEFVSNGSDVTIQGIYDEATLASLARSVVDSSK